MSDTGTTQPPAPPTPTVPPPPPPAQPDPLVQLNTWAQSIGAQQKAEGRQSVLKDIKEQLGFDTIEDAKAFVEAAKTREREGLSEADRKLAEASDKETAAAAAASKAAEATLRADKLVGLIKEGVDPKAAGVIVDLVKVDPNDYDDAKITAAVTELKSSMPQLFTGDGSEGEGEGEGTPSQGSGPIDSTPRGGPPQGSSGDSPSDKAKRRLASRHPELKKG